LTWSTEQALQSLERLGGSAATVILPGHGEPVGDPAEAVAEAGRRGPT